MDAKTYAIFKKVSESGGGADPVLQDKEVTITENGEITVEADSDYDGLSSVEITTIIPDPVLQDKEVTITENGETTVEADSDYDGLSSVEITTIIPDPVLQDKEVTITENGEITVEADSDYDGLSSVDITVAVPEPSGSIEIVENGTYDVTEKASAIVNVPSSGGGGVPALSKGVNFIDYDGTVVDTWETSIVASKTSLPDNPSHNGLTAQGWNWSLADIQSYIASYPDALVAVGQMYITDDCKTRIYIHLEEGRLSPYLGICPNGSVDIDWGDGTAHDTVIGTSATTVINTQHTYAHSGDYVITLSVTGAIGIKGCGQYDDISVSALLWRSIDYGSDNYVYTNAIKKVTLGSGVAIGDHAFDNCRSISCITIPNSVISIGKYAFYNCYSLSSITIPNGVTSIGEYTFNNCCSLSSITIPNGVTSIGARAFTMCNALSSITIPNSMTSIGNYAFFAWNRLSFITIPNSVTSIGEYGFNNCYSLSSITIPNRVTSIGKYAFGGGFGIGCIRFASQTPPTVSNINAWGSVQTDCIIYVPSGTLNAYKTATNYPSPSNYTYVEY